MAKKIKIIILFLFLLTSVLVVGNFAVAQGTNILWGGQEGSISNEIGLGARDPRLIIANVIRVALGFLGVIALSLIIYSGWTWMTAAGNPERIEKAKKILLGAVIGLVIVLSSFAITSFFVNKMFLATGGGCNPGDIQNCGCPALAATRTCQADGTWPPCAGGSCGALQCCGFGCAASCAGPPPAFTIDTFQPPDLSVNVIRNAIQRTNFSNNILNTSVPNNFRIIKTAGTGIAGNGAVCGGPYDCASDNCVGGFCDGDEVAYSALDISGDRISFTPLNDCPAPYAAWKCFDASATYQVQADNGMILRQGDSEPLDCSIAPFCTATFDTGIIIDTQAPSNLNLSITGNLCIDFVNTIDISADDDNGISTFDFADDYIWAFPGVPPTACIGFPPSVSCSGTAAWNPTSAAGYTAGTIYNLSVDVNDIDSNTSNINSNITLRENHCCNSVQDADEDGTDCGGADCAACSGAACGPSDINSCTADPSDCRNYDSVCSSSFCACESYATEAECVTAGYETGYGINDCCLCASAPVIDWVTPIGGFCDDDNNVFCQVDGDCGTTCNTTIANGADGNIVTIGGRWFGALGAGSQVVFDDGTIAPLGIEPVTINAQCTNYWSNNQIIVVVPQNLNLIPGIVITVTADSGLSDSTALGDGRGPFVDFVSNSIVRPGLCDLTPANGIMDDTLTYQGIELLNSEAYFGNMSNNVVALNSAFGAATNGTADVPNLTTGNTTTFVLNPAGVGSNYLNFTKDPEAPSGPFISSFEPTSGPMGQYVTIYGNGFGSSQGLSTVHFDQDTTLGGGNGLEANYNFPVECANSVWRDNQIIVKVPDLSTINDPDSYYILVDLPGVGITIDTSLLTPDQFNFSSALPLLPSLCKISPIMGPNLSPISLWGEYFGAQGTGLVRFQLNQDVNGSDPETTFWNIDGSGIRIDTQVPLTANSGPVKVVQGIDVGNGMNFQIGNCSTPDDCGGALEFCCPAGSYKEYQCAVETDFPADGIDIDDCYPEIGSSVFEWSFSTSPGTIPPTCSGYSLNQCTDSLFCPNSPGNCSPFAGSTNNVGSCTNADCNGVGACTASCVYDSILDKCKDPTQGNAGACSIASSTLDILNNPINAYCAGYSGNDRWHINTAATCPNSNWTRLPGNICVYEGILPDCYLCNTGFNCIGSGATGECAVNQNICPANSTCIAGVCEQTINASCECCCDIGANDPGDGTNPGCCSPSTCENSCGSGGNFGVCSGCGNAGTTQADFDAACNCIGTTGKVCAIDLECDDGSVGTCAGLVRTDPCNVGTCGVSDCIDPAGDCTGLGDGDACGAGGACGVGTCSDPAGNCTGSGDGDACGAGGTCGVSDCIDPTGDCTGLGDGDACGAGGACGVGTCSVSAGNCTGLGDGDTCNIGGSCIRIKCSDRNGTCTGTDIVGTTPCGVGGTCIDDTGECRDGTTTGAPCYDAGSPVCTNSSLPTCLVTDFCDDGAGCTCQPVVVGTPCDQDSIAPGCQIISDICTAADPTLYCDPGSCSCALKGLPTGANCEDITSLTDPLQCEAANPCISGLECSSEALIGPGNCGNCCCDINNDQCGLIDPDLSCRYDTGSGGACDDTSQGVLPDFGLCCGCSSDSQCGGGSSACGSDTCCRPRPTVLSSSPANGALNICRNTDEMSVTFNQQMDISSFSGNVVVVGDYGIEACPEGTQYILAEAESKNIIVRVFSKILNKIKKLFSPFLKEASALNNVFCAISGTVSGEHNPAGNQTTLTFAPRNLLDGDRTYYVIIKGDTDNTDEVEQGVLDYYGIGLMDNLWPDFDGGGVTDTDRTFNGTKFYGYAWRFTTMTALSPNNGICTIDDVELTPDSYLFQTTTDDGAEVDDNAQDYSFDSVSDSDKVFSVKAVSDNGQTITSVPAYSWTWSWVIVDPNIVDYDTNNPYGAVDDKQLIEADSDITDGQTIITVTATDSDGFTFSDSSDVWVFVCENPWPPVVAGVWAPWVDTDTNCIIGTGTCYETNQGLYYCRDAGGEGTSDDLPAILSGAGSSIIRGSSTVDNLIKEFYFLREVVPDITTGLSLSLADLSTTTEGVVQADWTAIAGIDGYNIYYGTSPGNYIDYIDVGNFLTKDVYGLNTGQTYYFSITTYITSTGAESENSPEVSITLGDSTPPDTPVNLAEISACNGEATIRWDANTDDTIGYRVYYGAAPGPYGGSVDAGDVTEVTLTGLGDSQYYFAVTAYDTAGNESTYSADVAVSITPVCGMVAYWPFEVENAGITPDEWGGNDGTMQGAASLISNGKIGSAMSFDGIVGNMVSIPGSNFIEIGRNINTYSISLWMNSSMTISGADSYIINKLSMNRYPFSFRLTATDDFISRWYDGVDSCGSSVSVDTTDGNWHMLVATYDLNNGVVTTYVDDLPGVQNTGCSLLGQPVWNDADINVPELGTDEYIGEIDELKIFNRVLSDTEILDMYNTDLFNSIQSSLVSYWRLDEGSGTIVVDSSGNGNDGTLVNSPTWQSSSSCKSNNCLRFDENQYASVPYSSSINSITDNFTIIAYVYPIVAPTPGGYIKSVDRGNSYSWRWGSNNNYLGCYKDGVWDELLCVGGDGGGLLNDQWYFVVMTYENVSGVGGKLYVDGNLESSNSDIGSIPTNTSPITIGGLLVDTNVGQSILDEVMIINRAINNDEASVLYNSYNP